MSNIGLLVVTGSSRGIGKAFATAFASTQWLPDITELEVSLIARSHDGLSDTKTQVLKHAPPSVAVKVSCSAIDLADMSSLESNVKNVFSSHTSQYKKAIFINNAGSIGPIGPTIKIHERLSEIQQSMSFNFSSSCFLSSLFADTFSPKCDDVTIVNVSSICGVEPFKTLALYCAGKSARDMFHSVLAEENSGIKVLNYAPGPVDTEMVNEMISTDAFDVTNRAFMSNARTTGTLVKAQDTAQALVEMVLQAKFESGSHVDYYDIQK